jgi:asparagine synthase (glutamine-hydrolysing)
VRRYVQSSNTPNPDRYSRWMMLQYFPPEKILGAGMPFRNGHGDLLAIARAHYQSAKAESELNRLMYLDVKMVLGDCDLPKVVRASELAGITVRFPFLDHPLAEFSGRIPSELKLKWLEKRYLFKKATKNLLPKAILQKKKHGFGLPMSTWLKSDPKIRGLAEDVLRDPRSCQRGYVRQDFIQYLFSSMDKDNTSFHGDVLYSFLMLELWYRKHVESHA